jgi:hypothetical protein
MFQIKVEKENQNTHLMFNKVFFFENRADYEIMWTNIVQLGRSKMTINIQIM